MVSAVSQATAPAAESVPSDSTAPRHWLEGRYFYCSPDWSDEARWTLYQGGAKTAIDTICNVLHDLERRGTEPQRAAARAGRIEHLGVTGLANFATGVSSETGKQMSTKAMLRQLRFLERQGFIRTWQPKFTVEVDPVTGKISKNYAKVPPKVIELTLKDWHFRPTRPVSEPRRSRCETHQGPKAVGCETHPKAPRDRVRNVPVPKDSDLQRDRSPSDSDRRQDASVPLGRPETPAAKANPGSGTTGLSERREEVIRSFYDPHDRASRQRLFAAYVSNCAKSLRITEAEVIEIGKRDKGELVRRLQDAGCDPATGRRIRHRVTDEERAAEMQRRLDERTGLNVRQAVTAAVSLHDEPQEARDAFGPADDTSAREEAAAGLRDALAAMSPTGRERSRDLGEVAEQIDAEADELLKVIEQRRAAEIEAQADSDRQCAELRTEVERQERQFQELRQRLGVGKLRCES